MEPIAVDQVLAKATLRDLSQNEEEMNSWVRTIPGPNGLRLILVMYNLMTEGLVEWLTL